MLNIGKLDTGKAQYYLDEVAAGVEDYYLHAGEAPGMWRGAAAHELGLTGEVTEEWLLAVLAGVHPATGERLAASQRSGERVPGFDLTFRVPKSVSLLHALCGPEEREQVRLAHQASVAAALAYLEREAGFGRRRVDGKIADVPTSGFVAAAFQHRTSRAGDPLLHHHVLVANLVHGADGRWGAVDARLIYTHAKTAGFLQEAELRAQLTERLGVEWQPVRNGTCDIQGFSRPAILGFSRRRQEIVARMTERGETSARAAQVATLDTRRAKDYGIRPEGLLPEWRARAEKLGLTPEALARTMRRPVAWAKSQIALQAALRGVDAELAGERGLTAQASTFSRRDAVQALCQRLPSATVDTVERAADRFLASPSVVRLEAGGADRLRTVDVIRLGSGQAIIAAPDERRYSTVELLETERTLVHRAVARNLTGRASPVASVSLGALEASLATRARLSDEQVAMVSRVTRDGQAVELVQGRAGSGKTHALDACRDAWESSGFTVLGCSLSAQAAAELQAGSGIPSSTIGRLLIELCDRPATLPSGRSVVVVDEAGMVGTRLLSRLMTAAEAHVAKVVLVGDDRQLPEIDAGGTFRGLQKALGSVELRENHRQREEWERQALDQLREGKAGPALRAYIDHSRVVVGASADSVRAKLVDDWWAAGHTAIVGGPKSAVMVALIRSDVRELNERARALRVAAGELTGPELDLASGRFSAGDRVVTGRNDRGLGLRNGTRGVVEAVDVDRGQLAIRTEPIRGEAAKLVVLPRDYLDEGHLTHAYAITGHKAQGMTADRAFILGDDALYREWGYVAMSRGREENRLYVVGGSDARHKEVRDGLHGAAAQPEQRGALRHVARALEVSRQQEMASDLAQSVSAASGEAAPGRATDDQLTLMRDKATAPQGQTEFPRHHTVATRTGEQTRAQWRRERDEAVERRGAALTRARELETRLEAVQPAVRPGPQEDAGDIDGRIAREMLVAEREDADIVAIEDRLRRPVEVQRSRPTRDVGGDSVQRPYAGVGGEQGLRNRKPSRDAVAAIRSRVHVVPGELTEDGTVERTPAPDPTSITCSPVASIQGIRAQTPQEQFAAVAAGMRTGDAAREPREPCETPASHPATPSADASRALRPQGRIAARAAAIRAQRAANEKTPALDKADSAAAGRLRTEKEEKRQAAAMARQTRLHEESLRRTREQRARSLSHGRGPYVGM